MILVIYKFRDDILESSRNVSESPPDSHEFVAQKKYWPQMIIV